MAQITSDTPSSIRELLASGGTFVGPCVGTSMRPLLRPGRDTVVVSACDPHALRPMDVCLFSQRRGDKDALVLHRVVSREPGGIVTLGDGCASVEHVPYEDVLGSMEGVFRDERPVDLEGSPYRLYVMLWCRPWRLRMRACALLIRLRRAL